jgi:pilus assembly protein CpaB
MNRKRLLLIGMVALLVGSLSSSIAYRSLVARITRPVPGVSVVVAAHDLAPGEPLSERDVRVVAYPAGLLPDGVLHSVSDALQRSVLLPLAKGQFLTTKNLGIDGDKPTLEHLIPAGMRAAAVSVDDVTSVAGFARPGSLVDVLVTGPAADTHRLQSVTVLQRVRVLAMGTQIEGETAKDVRQAHVVTLLVNPQDAETLSFAGQQGRIQLIIRNPVDASQEKRTPVYTLDGLQPARNRLRVKFVPAPAPPEHEIELWHGGHSERIKVKD